VRGWGFFGAVLPERQLAHLDEREGKKTRDDGRKGTAIKVNGRSWVGFSIAGKGERGKRKVSILWARIINGVITRGAGGKAGGKKESLFLRSAVRGRGRREERDFS